jgi:hypothetical protein
MRHHHPAPVLALALVLVLDLPRSPPAHAQSAPVATAPAASGAPAAGLLESLKFKGDLRYRTEWIDREDDDIRHRHRIRLRIGVETAPVDGWNAVVQLASGEDDPASANQTLGDGFSGKPVRLNLAYLRWTSERPGWEVQAGKVPRPFLCVTDLLWDGTVNPEGIGAFWSHEPGAVRWMLRGGGWWIEENADASDIFLWTAQAAAYWTVTEHQRLLGGLSLYAYDGLRGAAPLYRDRPMGNTMVPVAGADPDSTVSVFAEDFRIVEGFGQWEWEGFIPVALYGQAAVNTAADDHRLAWLAGLTVGRAHAVKSVEAGVTYRVLEADSTVGAFTDANPGGGGTDLEGWQFFLRGQVTRRLQCTASWYRNRLEPDGRNLAYDRWQFDTTLRF